MRLFIPTISTKLKLIEPWTFNLYEEFRNDKIYETVTGILFSNYRRNDSNFIEITFDKDTILSIARIYIRNGATEFDSVTFNIIETSDKRFIPIKKGGTFQAGTQRRFWAKLQDVNNMNVEVI